MTPSVTQSTDEGEPLTREQELELMLSEDELRGVPVLILANKQDMPGAMDHDEVSAGLGLDNIQNRQWQMFKTSAMEGSGLQEGFQWLANTLKGQ